MVFLKIEELYLLRFFFCSVYIPLRIIGNNVSGQRKELLNKLWKEEYTIEDRSRDRWKNSNVKLTEKYEAEFIKFYEQEAHSYR